MEAFTSTPCKILFILVLIFFFSSTYLSNQYANCPSTEFFPPGFLKTASTLSSSSSSNETVIRQDVSPRTNLSHLVFGLVGSEKAWHHRKAYIESWWRPNATRGYLFLDKPPSPDLLPWSPLSPPWRLSDDLTKFLNKNETEVTPQRIIHAVKEVYREDHENMRWLVMGDDDSIFFLDNIVDVLAGYDHNKYYYMGAHSEFLVSNYAFSFNQGFGGAGFILSYPVAKALAEDMENCLIRYRLLDAADLTTMSCVADIGVSLTSLKGLHQIDLHGDISGLLSSHPKFPLMSLHHFDMVTPIFPTKDRPESTRHLMKAAAIDQSRMLQQTICHHRPSNWTFSVSWGYSVNVYENIWPRSYLQIPIETFDTWLNTPGPPHYMLNTRLRSDNPCETPHVFFRETVSKTAAGEQILTSFSRAWPRAMPACLYGGNHSAESISLVQVYSPAAKRFDEMDRSECCDVIAVDESTAIIKYRECATDEIIA